MFRPASKGIKGTSMANSQYINIRREEKVNQPPEILQSVSYSLCINPSSYKEITYLVWLTPSSRFDTTRGSDEFPGKLLISAGSAEICTSVKDKRERNETKMEQHALQLSI